MWKLLLTLPMASALVQLHQVRTSTTTLSSASSPPDEDQPVGLQSLDDITDDNMYPSREERRMSQAIPFMECPQPLKKCNLAGNVGFDPLGLAKNEGVLMDYREAEIKHARLAMLAAAGWPLSELFDRQAAEFLGLPPIIDDHDRVPSLLNGGLEKVSPAWWGFCLGLTAAIDMYGLAKARSGDTTYFPGNLDFDPLGLYPKTQEGRERMQLAEIKHGRLAMIAVAGYALQEYATKLGVVDETPFFFLPITQSI